MSYGASLIALWKDAARYVDKILRRPTASDR